jgi:trimethylamine:corrinoid methyltransferase-like protein
LEWDQQTGIQAYETAFRDKPFLSLNVNHVLPLLRFNSIALEVMVNCFGQLGASSPVAIAGCVTQTIAGATDSKGPDAQSGYEKCLNVTQAVHAGANIITQACGAQAGLMGLSFVALVIDNDMLGSILRTSGPVAISPETIAPESIDRVACGISHFLG